MPSVHSSLPFILNLFLLFLTGRVTAHPIEQKRSDADISLTPLDLLRRDLQIRSFFTTPTIIALSAGGSSFLLIIILLCVCCHRKRKRGREILAAYESADRTPYEPIQLQRKKPASTSSQSTIEKSDVRKDGLQVHVSAVMVPTGGYSPRSSSLGPRGGQGVSVPGRVFVRGNGEREIEAGFIPPPVSPFTPRPTPPFSPYSPTTPPIPPYGPPLQRPIAGPYGYGAGGVIGGAL